jgi:hypothetical protein
LDFFFFRFSSLRAHKKLKLGTVPQSV